MWLSSTAGDDLDDFEAIAGVHGAACELGGGDSLAVMFDDDAAGQERLPQEELLDRTRQLRFGGPPVSQDRALSWLHYGFLIRRV